LAISIYVRTTGWDLIFVPRTRDRELVVAARICNKIDISILNLTILAIDIGIGVGIIEDGTRFWIDLDGNFVIRFCVCKSLLQSTFLSIRLEMDVY
jgi:hypothetical protein